MNQSDNTLKDLLVDEIVDSTLIENSETTSVSQTVVRNYQGTYSETGVVASNQSVLEINKDKPWREIIKRRFIDGGSDN